VGVRLKEDRWDFEGYSGSRPPKKEEA